MTNEIKKPARHQVNVKKGGLYVIGEAKKPVKKKTTDTVIKTEDKDDADQS
ncbi:MAG: hypothetical protein JRC86_02970 [Deltaproteobacteria bacterium]|nr:hypothetical protein [Deltaproteobacteria bacterium]